MRKSSQASLPGVNAFLLNRSYPKATYKLFLVSMHERVILLITGITYYECASVYVNKSMSWPSLACMSVSTRLSNSKKDGQKFYEHVCHLVKLAKHTGGLKSMQSTRLEVALLQKLLTRQGCRWDLFIQDLFAFMMKEWRPFHPNSILLYPTSRQNNWRFEMTKLQILTNRSRGPVLSWRWYY